MEELINIPKGYKQTKVGVIPEDWEEISIQDIATVNMGQSPDSDSYNSNGVGYFLIQGNADIQDRKSAPRIYTSSPTKFCEIGDILLSVRAPVGTVAKSLHNACIGRGVCSIRTNDSEEEFLYQYLLSFEKKWTKFEQGSTFTAINRNDIKRLPIPYPELNERKSIEQILSIWDKSISTTHSIIEELKLRNKGLAQQLLTGKKRLKGFEGEWINEHLEHFFIERKETGYVDLPLLSVGESGVYLQNESNKKDNSNSDKGKYKRICVGDIGYNTMRMWQGRSALSKLEGIVSPAYTIVTPKDNADAQFFAFLFKLDDVVHRFFRNSQGLVSDTLNCKFKDFKIVRIDAPSILEEQKAIAKVLLDADQEIKLYEKKLNTLKEQKKGLMQKLLTGEIRVKVD